MSAVLKRYGGALIFITVLSLASVLIIGFHFASRDVTWIGEVEKSIKKDNWEPVREPNDLMGGFKFFLYENGEEQFFYPYNHSEFFSYVEDLLGRVDRNVRPSISKESVDEILATDKVLLLEFRFWNTLSMNIKYDRAYFVLEDKQGTGLEGTIIIREQHMEMPYDRYSVWEVTNWFLW
jgi:hypothetical protein